MAYRDFKNLARRTASDKILRDNGFKNCEKPQIWWISKRSCFYVPDASGLVKKLDYNAIITEIENKISTISGLATNAALTAVENKIPNISSLVKVW